MNAYSTKRIIRTIPVILWSSLIFYLSSQDAVSAVSHREADIALHKLAHIIEYAILYIFFILATFTTRARYPKLAIIGVLFVALYGISDEIHQSFNPTRSPRVYDVLFDTLGGVFGHIMIKTALETKHKLSPFIPFR